MRGGGLRPRNEGLPGRCAGLPRRCLLSIGSAGALAAPNSWARWWLTGRLSESLEMGHACSVFDCYVIFRPNAESGNLVG